MEAGRELDALVAEKVMGWRRVSGDDVPGDEQHGDWLGGEQVVWITPTGTIEACSRCGNLPRFSSHITEAWRVVEKMRACPDVSRRNLQLMAYSYNRTYAAFDAAAAFDDHHPSWAEANGDLATPHAICLAALKAVAISSGDTSLGALENQK